MVTNEETVEEKTVSLSLDYKNWIIIGLAIFIALFWIGWISQDTGLQDNIRIIQEENSNVKHQNYLIQKADESISSSTSKIEKAKEVLKTKYSITFQ